MDTLFFFICVILGITTIVGIFVLFEVLGSKLLFLQKKAEQRKEQECLSKELERLSADSMKECAESTIDLAKSKYNIICEKIIEDIALSIKEQAKSGEKFEYFSIREMARNYLWEDRSLSFSQKNNLSLEFRDKYFCVIQEYFENRGFVVSKIKDDYELDIEILWE